MMKSSVAEDLEKENYLIFEEPLFPPTRDITWHTYRPDLFGVRASTESKEYAFVECETRPNIQRLTRKRYDTISVQTDLQRLSSVRRILAVPRGKLTAMDLRVRHDWEVWIVGERVFTKIPRVVPNR
jgi:hypothetical protein